MPDFDEQAVRAIQTADQLQAADDEVKQAFVAEDASSEGGELEVAAAPSPHDNTANA